MKILSMKIAPLFFILLFLFSCKGDPSRQSKNIVNIRLEGEPAQLNPILSTSGHAKQVEWQIFMPLLQYDAQTFELYPVLAKARPEITKIKNGIYQGGRAYTFEIRKEASWDDGKTVSASDVVFTLKSFLHPNISHPGLRSFLGFIKEIEIDHPKRFTVYTDQALNLAEEVIGTMAIYPKHIYDPDGLLDPFSFEDFVNQKEMENTTKSENGLIKFAEIFKDSGWASADQPAVGCGPYQLEEWRPGERIILKKKKNWWAEHIESKHQSFANYPEELNYQFIVDDATLLSLIKEEKVDVAASIDPVVFETAKKSTFLQERFSFETANASNYYFIAFHTKDPKLSDVRTRLAISQLVPTQELIRLSMLGYGSRIVGPILPGKSYYHKNLSPINVDLENAKQLLKEVGWNDKNQDGILEKQINGLATDFQLKYKYSAKNKIAEKAGILLKDNAQKVGVDIQLIPLERKRLVEDTRKRDFDLYCSQWSQRPGLDDLSSIWHTKNDTPRGYNKSGFGTPVTDALIDSINVELDEVKRTALYYKIQETIYEEQPYVFLFVPKQRIILHKRFEAAAQNLRPGFFENTFHLAK